MRQQGAGGQQLTGPVHADDGEVGRGVIDQQQELFAPPAGEHVGVAQGALQRGGKLAQHLVAQGMAMGVVELLEVVDVHEDHRQSPAIALGTVDFTYQNLESVELGINDVDQYVDGLGGVTRSVARAKGAETPVYILDATRGSTKVRTLGEQIDLETRTRTLNPKWFEGLLEHGYEGVRQIEGHVTSTLGWSATTGQVAPWVYQKISETFVLDAEMRRRMSNLNPKSAGRVASRLLEACDRNLWAPDDATLAALREANDELEDRLEGVFPAE